MKLLLYCCKKPHKLFATDEGYALSDFELGKHYKNKEKLNGKIVAECDFEVIYEDTSYSCIDFRLASSLDGISRLDKSCLTTEQLFDYVKGKNEFYSIYIKNLNIFDKPRELKEYDDEMAKPLNKAPQNMMYAFKYITNQFQEYILISIRPEWLCKILNGEKTIEVRKKVLKEML